jgi:hypothetical protein
MKAALAVAALLAGPAMAGSPPADPMPPALELRAHERLMRSLDATTRTPAPFETDGCSGGLSAAWETIAAAFPDFAEAHRDRPPWEACCITHDRAYHDAGGAVSVAESLAARLAADETLRLCVIETGDRRTPEVAALYGLPEETVRTGYAALAAAMFRAVRLGGAPCSGLSWRWGFGFPACR